MSTVQIILIDSHHLVRERTFAVSRELGTKAVEKALLVLKSEHATGKLVANLTNGSIGSLQFEERAKLIPGR